MQRWPERKWTVEDLAAAARLGRTRFSVLYKEYFGAGAIEDLIGFRIQKAQSLMATTHTPVRDVAYACGFDDPNYFCKTFSSRVGCSPSQYRQR
jgi:transcriptional regulator GlxA family with amidase domain